MALFCFQLQFFYAILLIFLWDSAPNGSVSISEVHTRQTGHTLCHVDDPDMWPKCSPPISFGNPWSEPNYLGKPHGLSRFEVICDHVGQAMVRRIAHPGNLFLKKSNSTGNIKQKFPHTAWLIPYEETHLRAVYPPCLRRQAGRMNESCCSLQWPHHPHWHQCPWQQRPGLCLVWVDVTALSDLAVIRVASPVCKFGVTTSFVFHIPARSLL